MAALKLSACQHTALKHLSADGYRTLYDVLRSAGLMDTASPRMYDGALRALHRKGLAERGWTGDVRCPAWRLGPAGTAYLASLAEDELEAAS